LQQLVSLWNALDTRRRVIVSIASFAVFAAVLLLARLGSNPSMSLLYSGLDPSVSGEVVAALEQRNVAYSVQGNAIYVDRAKRDETRMSLAGDGLPATGSDGYELLDSLSGFGTTAQMFDAAYWRAKEGELARTILAWPQVKTARVHIANQVARPFAQAPAPVASVTLKMSAGALSRDRARALRFLVASAVAGMSPADVSVIDSESGLISPDGPLGSTGGNSGGRATTLRNNIERLLSARVGPGNALVEVSIDTALERETIVERRFDPDGRVAISTDTEETAGSSSGSGAAPVTVASNLPDGAAAPAESSSKSTNTETRERINYEVSETTRELIREPGTINRLSVAVLVNGLSGIGADGRESWVPRSTDELDSLRELVQTAVGFDADRGDVVTIKSLQFLPRPEAGTLATASIFAGFAANAMMFVQSGLLALVILGLGMFVVRPILTQPPPVALPGPVDSLAELGSDAPGGDLQFAIAGPDDTPTDPVSQLRQIIAERQDETVEVLRNWIETSEEHA